MIGHKVVRKVFSSYQSCTSAGHIVNYVPNKPANSPIHCGPLAAFNTYEKALAFVGYYKNHMEAPYLSNNLSIWKSECVISDEHSLWVGDNYGSMRTSNSVPRGTIFCKSIKLLEQIYPKLDK